MRNELVEVFVKYGKSIIPILIERLKEEDLEIKSSTIIALGRIGDKSVVPHIVEVLNNHEELAVVCAGALAKIGNKSALCQTSYNIRIKFYRTSFYARKDKKAS
ncbi:MAG: HEAT repeat domain-containing protein [Dictyoglomus sp.]